MSRISLQDLADLLEMASLSSRTSRDQRWLEGIAQAINEQQAAARQDSGKSQPPPKPEALSD